MILLVFIWAIGANWLAYNKGFYRRTSQTHPIPSISHLELITSFALYLLFSYVLIRLILALVIALMKQTNSELTIPSAILITSLQFSVMSVLFFALQSFFYRRNKKTYQTIWKDRQHIPPAPAGIDFALGVCTWFLSFPIVSVLSDFIESILKSLFQFQHQEQNAVRFLQFAAKSPPALGFALASILILAPFVEEFLFRGVLQTYFKKRLGVGAAILLSSFIFALFHFSPAQGMANIPLIISLCILGGFLGFLYEKRGSLWAPIGLHVSFNAISALRILLFPELS